MFKNKCPWIPVFLWMGLIFYLSHQVASDSNQLSMGVTKLLIDTIHVVLPNLDINLFNHIIRKNAHFIAYFILGLLTINALYLNSYKGKKAVLLSIFISISYAISDEMHQLFIPGRAGQIKDLLIDSIGAILGIFIYIIIIRIIKARKQIQ